YENRESQVEMLKLVCRAFNGDELCAAEAGTGVGKSLAYLLPSLSWALQNGERVVISTNTINLQQQLVEKDIPLVKRILDQDPKVVLVKGRGNYLCAHRLSEALEEMSLFEDRDPELLSIRDWARTTETGSRTDLSFYPSDEVWSRVCSEADTCLGLRCGHRDGCFVLKARREASSAQVLVANHHLLFADLALRIAGSGFEDPAVLPPFRRIVFDEAHNIEKAATSFFSQSFSRFAIARFLGRLYRRKRGKITGLFPQLARHLGRSELTQRIPSLIFAALERGEEVDEACLALMGEEGSLLLDARTWPTFLNACSGALGNLSFAIQETVQAFSNAIEAVEAAEKGPETENTLWDCRVQLTRLSGIVELCNRFRSGDPGRNDIFWLESVRRKRAAPEAESGSVPATATERSVRLIMTPLDIGPMMRDAVYEPIKSAVFTSATLTVGGSFSFWSNRIGLDRNVGREPLARIFPSPFNYREQVLLGVPTDAPTPDSPPFAAYVARFVTEAVLASRGAALVLFTSYSLLRETHAAALATLAQAGIRILRQGEDDRARLLEAFRSKRSNVLFATDSFWEGVDAPGDTLELVVLCRLPFRVPSEPVLKARMIAIEARGGNPFSELSLPDAVVRLRQGFGRLMRRHDDTGVVLVLDSRIVSRTYGAVFMDSLPVTRRSIAPSSEVLADVREFFSRRESEGEEGEGG
ncbi:MAG TPA: helicase C-terminal domain-containing protein, partial [Spirochaetia bacterium]|nr:helicase C-terminal domain-containing protein [Spirochaetia bacterium]